MDEHREERLELDEIQRENEDEERTYHADRIEWATEHGYSWPQFVSAETELWARP